MAGRAEKKKEGEGQAKAWLGSWEAGRYGGVVSAAGGGGGRKGRNKKVGKKQAGTAGRHRTVPHTQCLSNQSQAKSKCHKAKCPKAAFHVFVCLLCAPVLFCFGVVWEYVVSYCLIHLFKDL